MAKRFFSKILKITFGLLLLYLLLVPPLLAWGLRHFFALQPVHHFEQSYGRSVFALPFAGAMLEGELDYQPYRLFWGEALRGQMRWQNIEIDLKINPLAYFSASLQAPRWHDETLELEHFSAQAKGHFWGQRITGASWQASYFYLKNHLEIKVLSGNWQHPKGMMEAQPRWLQDIPEIQLEALWQKPWQLQWEKQADNIHYLLQAPSLFSLEHHFDLQEIFLDVNKILVGAILKFNQQAVREEGWYAALSSSYGSILLPQHEKSYIFQLDNKPHWRLKAPSKP